MTLKEWNRFNKILKDSEGNFVPPGNELQYRNHFTGKLESLQTITGQEVLLSKYKIIIDGFETKWTRRYHKITKYVNMKNLDKSLIFFGKSIQSFSNGMEQIENEFKQNKKKQKTSRGRKSKRHQTKSVNDVIWGRKSNGYSRNSLKIWNTTDNFEY
jgi:hypothetical protein